MVQEISSIVLNDVATVSSCVPLPFEAKQVSLEPVASVLHAKIEKLRATLALKRKDRDAVK